MCAISASSLQLIERLSFLLLETCRSDQKELKQWEKGTLKLAALASLTGCPQVYIAVVEAHHRCILLSAPEISVVEKAVGRILEIGVLGKVVLQPCMQCLGASLFAHASYSILHSTQNRFQRKQFT